MFQKGLLTKILLTVFITSSRSFWSLRIDKTYRCQNYKRVVQLIVTFPSKKKATYCLYYRKSTSEPRNVILCWLECANSALRYSFFIRYQNRILIATCIHSNILFSLLLLALFLLNYPKDSLTLFAWNQITSSVVRKF